MAGNDPLALYQPFWLETHPGTFTDGFSEFTGPHGSSPAIGNFADGSPGPVTQSGYRATQSELVGNASVYPMQSDLRKPEGAISSDLVSCANLGYGPVDVMNDSNQGFAYG